MIMYSDLFLKILQKQIRENTTGGWLCCIYRVI